MNSKEITSEYVNFETMSTSELYYQLPKWLMKEKYSKISPKSKLMYMIILDECKISYIKFILSKCEKNFELWDYEKETARCKIEYITFIEQLGISSRATISKLLKDLVELNLIEKKKNSDNTIYYYVKEYVDEK